MANHEIDPRINRSAYSPLPLDERGNRWPFKLTSDAFPASGRISTFHSNYCAEYLEIPPSYHINAFFSFCFSLLPASHAFFPFSILLPF